MAKKDFYEVLGISKSASTDEIRQAHRKLVRKFHPDVTPKVKDAEDRFKEVQEAYDVLSDKTKRANYDQFGHAGVGMGENPGAGGVDPFEAYRRSQQRGARPGSRQGRGGNNVSVEDFDVNGGGMSDIFEQIFGRTGPRRGRNAQPQPQAEPVPSGDVEYPATLTFVQAARGTTLPLQIDRGGQIETIEVHIPAGVKDGSRVRIKGKGQQNGRQSGDLFIITKILPHDFFRREGLDIYIDVPLSLYESLLGAKVEVPTIDGPVTITIPPGTSSGAKLRIRGHGIERSGEKGDQFAVLKIIVPRNLDDADKKLIQSLQEKYPLAPRADLKW